MNILSWFRLARIEHSIMVAFTIIASAIVSSKQFNYLFLLSAIGPFLVTNASFIINDFFDYKTDKALKRIDRPLVAKEVSRKKAFWIAGALYFLGITVTYFNEVALAITSVYAVFSIIYTPILKKLPLLGNLYIASTMAIPFIYGNLVASQELNNYVIIFSAMALSAGLGRELLNTLRDVQGDKKTGAKTLPMYLGAKTTTIISSILIIVAIALSLLPLQEKLETLYTLLIIPANIFFSKAVARCLKSQERKELQKCRNYTLYGLIIGIIAFASLALK